MLQPRCFLLRLCKLVNRKCEHRRKGCRQRGAVIRQEFVLSKEAIKWKEELKFLNKCKHYLSSPVTLQALKRYSKLLA
jgi:hypothetical protein